MSKLQDAVASSTETGPRSGARDDPAAEAAALLKHGVAAASRGDADAAVALFAQAVALRPDFAAAHANLGLLLLAAQHHAEAAFHLQAAVNVMPGDAALQNALGVAQESLNRLIDAERSYGAALALNPAQPEAHANLGNCLRRLGRLDEARAHYARALELKPDFAVAHYNLGILLQDRGDLEQAMARYRQALAIRPDYIEALNNLGSCQRAHGLVDEARATFERILERRPTQIEAHCNLAQYKTYEAGDPHVETLLAQQPRLASLSEDGRIRYWFTVGKMLEDVGRHDESFAAYAQANRAKHAITPWDEAAHQDVQHRIVATFTRERMRRADAVDTSATAEGPTPVFIVGMPRSGTSLLEQVLSTLPGVHGAGEITWLAETLLSAQHDCEEGGFQFPETLGSSSGSTLRALGRRHVARLRELAPQATHVVDKLPANFTHVGLIHLMFPQARIVHAMRDPMDSCFSCYSRLFAGNNLGFTYDLETVGRYWVGYHELMRHWRDVLPPGRMLDVAYETMVADFENQARRVVDYLGLPWDERCLGFHDSQRVVRTASVAQVRRPIYRTSVARWKPYERHLRPLRDLVEPYRSAWTDPQPGQ
jgi:tetratricopeptide (TPR) repeat protein